MPKLSTQGMGEMLYASRNKLTVTGSNPHTWAQKPIKKMKSILSGNHKN